MKKIFLFLIPILLLGGDATITSTSGYAQVIANGYVKGLKVFCIDNNNEVSLGETDEQGRFNPTGCTNIRLKIGNLTIVNIDSNNNDEMKGNKKLYIPRLINLDKTNSTDKRVVNILRLLQTLDSRNFGDPRDNIIEINSLVHNNINDNYSVNLSDSSISEDDLKAILADANIDPNNLMPEIKAKVFYERFLKDNNIDIEHTEPFKPELTTKSNHPFVYILKTNPDDYIGTRNDGSSGKFKISLFAEKGSDIYLNGVKKGTVGDDWIFYIPLTHSWSKFNEYNIISKDKSDNNSSSLNLKIYKVASNPDIQNSSFDCVSNSLYLNISDYDLFRAYNELNLNTYPHTITFDKNINITSFSIQSYTDSNNIPQYDGIYKLDCSGLSDGSNSVKITIKQNRVFNAFTKVQTITITK